MCIWCHARSAHLQGGADWFAGDAESEVAGRADEPGSASPRVLADTAVAAVTPTQHHSSYPDLARDAGNPMGVR